MVLTGRGSRRYVLYSWAKASDHQWLYEDTPPHLVYSVDHGHFLGDGGPRWTVQDLQAQPSATWDGTFAPCKLTDIELAAPLARLQSVTKADVEAIVAGPRPDWSVTLEERAALADYLFRRKLDLVP